MSIREMKQFAKWAQEGDASLQKRYDMFLEHRKAVEQQMENLSKMLAILNHKCLYYETALQTGSEKNIMQKDTLPYADEFLCRKCKS